MKSNIPKCMESSCLSLDISLYWSDEDIDAECLCRNDRRWLWHVIPAGFRQMNRRISWLYRRSVGPFFPRSFSYHASGAARNRARDEVVGNLSFLRIDLRIFLITEFLPSSYMDLQPVSVATKLGGGITPHLLREQLDKKYGDQSIIDRGQFQHRHKMPRPRDQRSADEESLGLQTRWTVMRTLQLRATVLCTV